MLNTSDKPNCTLETTPCNHEIIKKVQQVRGDITDLKKCINIISNIVLKPEIKDGIDVASNLASTATNLLLFNKWGREALLLGTMYVAGGAIVATVGIVPVVATGAAIYWFS